MCPHRIIGILHMLHRSEEDSTEGTWTVVYVSYLECSSRCGKDQGIVESAVIVQGLSNRYRGQGKAGE